jgi:elongation factor G
MGNADVASTRNFALIGHAGDGKTSLGEALLHRAGALETPGSVDDGSSTLNYLPEEKTGHHASVSSHIFSFDWSGAHLCLIDTPGDPNFRGDGEVALQAVDGAVLLVSGCEGQKFGTSHMLRAAKAAGVTVVGFISSLDHERADFEAALASLAGLDAKPVPLAFPVGLGDGLSAVVDLVHMVCLGPDGESPIPDAVAEEAETRRLELMEAAAESNDELLEKYLEEGELSQDELLQGVLGGVRSGSFLPILCGSASRGIGVELLLRNVLELLPSPADRSAIVGEDLASGEPVEVPADPDAAFSAVVFKTIVDRYAGTLSVFRVVSGTLRPDMAILNASTDTKLKVGKLMALQAEKHTDLNEAGPGMIAAVAKLKDVHTGHVLTAQKGGVKLASPTIPQGVLSYAIQPESQGDEDKVYAALGRLVEEDPTLSLGREASTGEFLLTGMGELHIRTTVHKLQRVYDVSVTLKTPKVPYRETVSRKASGVEGKLKKQSGGKGMYGVCYLDIEPRSRGEGIEFVDKIVGGAIPRGLIPAVEKGILEGCVAGPLAGYPVVDVRVSCVDGKHHAVDSNEMAFKLAASFGFKAGMLAAGPTLLEPVMTAEVSVPDDNVGDVMGDIASRRGRVQTSENRSGASVIIAQVPMSEMLEYASVLTSLTGGKGAFHMEFSHYDEAPAQVREKVIAESQKPSEEHD